MLTERAEIAHKDRFAVGEGGEGVLAVVGAHPTRIIKKIIKLQTLSY